MRTLGLIGGMSWESTALYYRMLNQRAKERLGGLHSAKLLLWSFDFAEIEAAQSAGDWDRATAMMAEASQRLAKGGAEAIVICTNTMHRMADEVEAASGLPVIHIADAAGKALRDGGIERPLLLATRFTMEQAFYRGRLADRFGISSVVPDEAGRAEVHRVIYEELCQGVISPRSKAGYLDIIARTSAQGCDGVILGCTEVGLLIGQDDLDLPVFDTTELHAKAAMDFALAD
ncbi:MAG: aspartate/glutamate racemase family protein [Pseudomonadota bacterium]